MADIRFKDLTTTASSTASDDFIAVDGTTNGTRKLSAFSPTFGGNATVTGTLTVNGATLTSTGDISVAADKGIYLKQGNVHKWTSDGTSSGTSRADIYADSGGAFFIRTGGATQALTISSSQGATFAGAVAIPATTASTTTSSGALVVGNGTSGGLGVGGAINSGGAITAGVGTHSFGTSAGGGVNSFGSLLTYFNIRSTSDSDNPTFRIYDGRVNVSAFEVNARTQVVTLPGTTASTSTSSGALVVSGGVGVAGAVFTGGYVHPGGDSTFYIRGTGSNNGLIRGNVTSVDVDTSFGVRNGDGSSTYLSVASTGLIAAIPATAPSLTVNGTMTFERTSNTSLKISVRGTDGTTRSVSLTLA